MKILKPQKLTKTIVANLTCDSNQPVFVRDNELKGFGVRVGKTHKSYFVEKRVKGKNLRKVIGNVEHYTTEEARKRAQKLLGLMADGYNPAEEEKKSKAKSETLAGAFSQYLKVRKLKPSTISNMTHMMTRVFPDWQNRQLNDISRDMVQKRHLKLSQDNGIVQADNAMRSLRTVYNFAMAQYVDENDESLIKKNPVDVLSATKAWHPKTRRQSIVEEHDLQSWFKAVLGLADSAKTKKAEVVRDYLLVCLLTGLRRNEAAKLKWSNVNLVNKTLAVEETKNGKKLVLPLTDALVTLFTARKQKAKSIFVFPGNGADGYLKEPRRQIKKVEDIVGSKFMIHDLRRNFITAAYQLVPYYVAKRLANHAISQSDVSDGYNVITLENMREPMQRITDFFFSTAKIDKTTFATIETKLVHQI